MAPCSGIAELLCSSYFAHAPGRGYPRVRGLRAERRVMTTTTPATLPTEEELRAAFDALADAWEDHVDPLAKRVFAVTNSDDPEVLAAVSMANVGEILYQVHECRGLVETIDLDLKKVEHTTLDDLAVIAKDGERMHTPRYDEAGRSNYPA
jgi:hypothetical protein